MALLYDWERSRANRLQADRANFLYGPQARSAWRWRRCDWAGRLLIVRRERLGHEREARCVKTGAGESGNPHTGQLGDEWNSGIEGSGR